MAGNEIQGLQAGLKAAKEQVEAAIAGITESEARQQPAPDDWSVSQLLAHIAEIIGFWMDKAVLITEEKDPHNLAFGCGKRPATCGGERHGERVSRRPASKRGYRLRRSGGDDW